MKKVNVNKIFVMDLCRCKYFGQVHLITVVTECSMVNNNNQGTVYCQVQVIGIGLQPKIK